MKTWGLSSPVVRDTAWMERAFSGALQDRDWQDQRLSGRHDEPPQRSTLSSLESEDMLHYVVKGTLQP